MLHMPTNTCSDQPIKLSPSSRAKDRLAIIGIKMVIHEKPPKMAQLSTEKEPKKKTQIPTSNTLQQKK